MQVITVNSQQLIRVLLILQCLVKCKYRFAEFLPSRHSFMSGLLVLRIDM